ncbi:MAG TPA: branched-chain amino acid ABC transporter permease [Herpetosiphonaceae bacterium]|nr:branched-chain amino acid ABC transporter permease [Herpetosiphonaceae bacterium]
MIRAAGDFRESYAEDMAAIRRPGQWLALLGLIGLLYAAPLYASESLIALLNRILISVIAVQGLNLVTGYTGQVSLGQAAFMTVGGYCSTLLMIKGGWPFWLALPAAGLGAGLVGLLFALPSLRIKGFYLTMATLSAQFIIPWFIRNAFPETLNQTQGLKSPEPVLFGITFNDAPKYLFLTLTCVIISTVVARNITRSRAGRAFVAVRDNDLAAELLGVNLFLYKLQAFWLAAIYAGVAGVLSAHQLRYINYDTFDLTHSILLLGMLVVGGLGTNLGPFFGATLVLLLTEAATTIGPRIQEIFPNAATTAARPLLFGIALMIFLIYQPRGLAYRWQRIRTAWLMRPFRK